MPVGRVAEGFATGRYGLPAGAGIEEWPVDTVPMHEFMRRVVKTNTSALVVPYEKFKVVKTALGWVVAREHRAQYPGLGTVRPVDALWVSGNVVVQVFAQDSTLADVLKVYGDRFPSTLPADIDLDRTEWYRGEVDLILSRMERAVGETKLTRCEWFGVNLHDLLCMVAVPGFDFTTANDAGRDPARKQALYGKLKDWWKENRDKTELNPRYGEAEEQAALVVKQ